MNTPSPLTTTTATATATLTTTTARRLPSAKSWAYAALSAALFAVLTSCSQGQVPTAPTASTSTPAPVVSQPTQPDPAAQPAQPAQPVQPVQPTPGATESDPQVEEAARRRAPVQPAPTPVQPVPAPTPAPAPTPLNPGGWRDTFDGASLDAARWSPSTDQWAAFWATNGLKGSFSGSNLRLDGSGHLLMQLDITRTATGFAAKGAELVSNQKFGYGSYEFRMRTASTSSDPNQPGRSVSGTISAAFNYVNDSATEIDHEIQGQQSNVDWVAAWKTTAVHSYRGVETGVDLSQAFHTYRWDWLPGRVDFFIDGVFKHSITQDVPSEEASVILNLWPTNSTNWGGMATEGTVYMLVDYAQFNPISTSTQAGAAVVTPLASAAGGTQNQDQDASGPMSNARASSTGRSNSNSSITVW